MRPLSSIGASLKGAIGKVGILKDLGMKTFKKGLFLQGGQDGQDAHYLGQGGHNMAKMAKFICGLAASRRSAAQLPGRNCWEVELIC